MNNPLSLNDVSTGTQNASDRSITAIELRDVTKRFPTPTGKAYTAIRDFNLAVAPGEFVAVVGPTGCGKSTTLGLISGLERPSEGSVQVMGKPVQGIDPRIGYVFQADAVFPWKSVLNNVATGPLFRGQSKAEALERARDWITRVISSGVGKVLVDLRSPASTQAALGGPYPFICLFMNNSYVSSHQDVVQKLVNAYVKTLKWIHTHTAEQIAAMMPPDYYAGNKALYVSALQNQLAIFSPDGLMPPGAPESVLSVENASQLIPAGSQINLNSTFTNEFASKAP